MARTAKYASKSPKKRVKNPTKCADRPPKDSQLLTPAPNPDSERQAEHSGEQYIYNNFIVFVDDPKLKSPFTILRGTEIQCLEKKAYVNDRFLNNDRRRRQYDVAFTNLYTFPCRIFAKAENTTKPIVLHRVCDNLNEKFKVLMACKVPVETAYERMMQSNPRKVKNGIEYETGSAEDTSGMLPDTASSYSEKSSPAKHISDDDANDSKSNVESDTEEQVI